MSAGSDASNLGYGNIKPFSNIDRNFVNVNNSHDPSLFGSKQIPGLPELPGLPGVKDNVIAAKGIYPNFFGGAKILKKKIKNISKRYKNMNKKSKMSKTIKNRIKMYMSKLTSKNIAGGKLNKTKRRITSKRHNKKHRIFSKKQRVQKKQKGGYSQYQNNLPLTNSYSLGGNLEPSNSALANPPPLHLLKGSGQCTDNYNHYTNKGSPSLGH